MATDYDGAVRIARTPEFGRRVELSLVEVAQEVLSEPLNTQYHADRLKYAQDLLRAEIESGRITIAALVAISGNESILDPDAPNHGVTDAQVVGGIRSHWNDLAGIEQSS